MSKKPVGKFIEPTDEEIRNMLLNGAGGWRESWITPRVIADVRQQMAQQRKAVAAKKSAGN